MKAGDEAAGSSTRPRAAVLLTGSELVTGVIADANGPWLARELTARGFEVAHLQLVGDRPGDLEAALRYAAAAGSALIVTSGGLGPTADDLTGEVVAEFAGVDLVLDEAMRERIAGIVAAFPRAGRDPAALDAAVRKQALVPRGAVALDPAGTAPGLVVPTDAGPVFHRRRFSRLGTVELAEAGSVRRLPEYGGHRPLNAREGQRCPSSLPTAPRGQKKKRPSRKSATSSMAT